jgi:predicted deacylase
MQILAVLLIAFLLAGCGGVPGGTTAPPPPPAVKETVVELAPATKYATKAYIYEAAASGPAVLLVGGVHGNEPAGSLAAEKFLSPQLVKGTLIVVPRANNLALDANKRTLPEITDLNRAYPGTADGNPAQQLAYGIGALMARYKVSLVIDLHEARTFHYEDESSLGQTVIYGFDDRSAMLALAVVEHMNKGIGEQRKKFTFLANPVKGSTAYYASNYLKIPAFTIETSSRQPIDDRVGQHVEIVRFLLAAEGLLK